MSAPDLLRVGEKKPEFNLEHCSHSTRAVMVILCSPISILSFPALLFAPRVQSCRALWFLLDLANGRNQLKMRSLKEIVSRILFQSIPLCEGLLFWQWLTFYDCGPNPIL